MVDPTILQTLISAPPLFGLIFYLMNERKSDKADRKAEIERRDAIDKDRIETDKALVAVLTEIKTKVGVSA